MMYLGTLVDIQPGRKAQVVVCAHCDRNQCTRAEPTPACIYCTWRNGLTTIHKIGRIPWYQSTCISCTAGQFPVRPFSLVVRYHNTSKDFEGCGPISFSRNLAALISRSRSSYLRYVSWSCNSIDNLLTLTGSQTSNLRYFCSCNPKDNPSLPFQARQLTSVPGDPYL